MPSTRLRLPDELWYLIFDHLFNFTHELEVQNWADNGSYPVVYVRREEDDLTRNALKYLVKHDALLFEDSRNFVMGYLIPKARWTIRLHDYAPPLKEAGLFWPIALNTRLQTVFQRPVRHIRILFQKFSYSGCRIGPMAYVTICQMFKNLDSIELCMDVETTMWDPGLYISDSSGHTAGFSHDSDYVKDTIESLAIPPSSSHPASLKSNLSVFEQLQEHCISLKVLIRDNVLRRRPEEAELNTEQLKWAREEDITSLFSHSALTTSTVSTIHQAVRAYERKRGGRKIRREDGTVQLSYLIRLEELWRSKASDAI